MSRARTLKPGFFKNEELAELEPLARILFAGLWCLADRAGRLEDRPRRIKAELLPYDNCNIDALLRALDEHGFILRYVSDGERFIQVLAFTKHQTPHIKEPASTIPAPDKTRAAAPDRPDAGTGQAPDKHQCDPSDSPCPDSPCPLSPSPEGGGRGLDASLEEYIETCPDEDRMVVTNAVLKLRQARHSCERILWALQKARETAAREPVKSLLGLCKSLLAGAEEGNAPAFSSTNGPAPPTTESMPDILKVRPLCSAVVELKAKARRLYGTDNPDATITAPEVGHA